MNRLKSAIVGLGFIGPAHVEALRRSALSDVVAVADANRELADAFVERFGIARAYTDYNELMDDPQIDVVHICAPNHLHFEIAKAALLKGKHVVCEKPLVTRVAEAEELVELAKKVRRVAAVSFNLRYYPLVQHARALVEKGALGKLYAYHGSYLQDWLLLETDYSWRLSPTISGPSRAFADIGSHWLDMAEFITGKKVSSLCADTATFLPTRKKSREAVKTFAASNGDAGYDEVEIETEDYAAVLFRFEDGMRGSLTVSQMAAGRKNRLTFEADGEKGALAWDSENPNELWLGHRLEPNGLLVKDPALLESASAKFASFPGGHTEGFPDTTKQIMAEIYAYILRGGLENGEPAPFPTFADGCREVRLCNAVLESARTRAWVDV